MLGWEMYQQFYSDTMFSNITSQRNNTMGQIFVNSAGFTYFIPMQTKSDAHQALHDFIVNVGIMSEIVTDGAPELTAGKWKEITSTY
jgi:hypothetical protein